MAIRQFELGPHKGLVRAQAADLPNLVAIAGPNGAGKSALLELLWRNRQNLIEAGTQTLFVGAHRTWRSGEVSDISVRGFSGNYTSVLEGDSLPGFAYAPPGGHHWLGDSLDNRQTRMMPRPL